MPANKLNYVVLYIGDSQVYGASTKEVALSSPPPEGVPLENKRVGFITFQPDSNSLMFHPIDQEEVMNADLKYPKKKGEEE